MNEQLQQIDEAEEILDEVVENEGQEHETDPPVEKNWSSEEEDEARLLGWKPPEEWKGEKPSGYIDNPTDYLERLQRSTPFRKLQEMQEDKIRRLEATMQAQQDRLLRQQEAEYQRQMQMIAARQRKAVEEADTETWDRLEQHKRSIQPPEPMQQPQTDPVEPYIGEHTWLKDPMLRSHGAQVIDVAMRSGELPPNADPKTQVEYAEAKVRAYFPHMFEVEQKPKPKAKVDAGGLAGGQKRSGFDSLPRDVKEAFQRQVQKGIFEDTKEDKEFFYNEYTGA